MCLGPNPAHRLCIPGIDICTNACLNVFQVHLQCGKTNELVSVSEPNRCEYRFVFNTPAICSQQPEPPKEHPTHEDL